jgi:hypothetical protein
MRGLFRLCLQLGIFLLLLHALAYTGNPADKRGIYSNLAESFGFASLWAVNSRNGFKEALGGLSTAYKKYFMLSPVYFDTLGKGDVQMIGNWDKFTKPRVLSGFDLSIGAPTISFTAWVKTTPLFQSGYIIRKRPSSFGPASALSCWAWFLDARDGPKFLLGSSFVWFGLGSAMKTAGRAYRRWGRWDGCVRFNRAFLLSTPNVVSAWVNVEISSSKI